MSENHFFVVRSHHIPYIGVLGVGGTKNSSKEEESEAKNEETGMYYNLSDEETERLATLPVGLQGFVVV